MNQNKTRFPLSSGKKAQRTSKWAKVMTKWLISFSTRGSRWHFVGFEGTRGSESRGIVDFIAVRKDHSHASPTLKRGDVLDIVLLQVKGGSARRPTDGDMARLRAVARHHRAKAVVLAEWTLGSRPVLFEMKRGKWDRKHPIDPGRFFE